MGFNEFPYTVATHAPNGTRTKIGGHDGTPMFQDPQTLYSALPMGYHGLNYFNLDNAPEELSGYDGHPKRDRHYGHWWPDDPQGLYPGQPQYMHPHKPKEHHRRHNPAPPVPPMRMTDEYVVPHNTATEGSAFFDPSSLSERRDFFEQGVHKQDLVDKWSTAMHLPDFRSANNHKVPVPIF